MGTPHPKNILIAPLDWGLGHTTRCMPLISHLLHSGHNPIVAGNEAQCSFIKESYGTTVTTVPLPGYNVHYSALNRFAQSGLIMQLPAIMAAIKKEHSWLHDNAANLQLHGIISDNRYGMFHSTIPSVVMTHQLHVLSGLGKAVDGIVRRIHYKYLQRFNEVWVPDVGVTPGLAGILAHPRLLPVNTNYVGLLSRFAGESATANAADGPLVVLLSGPEPQRSKLSAILWWQLQGYAGSVIFIEGSTTAPAPAVIPPNITYYKRLPAAALLPVLKSARMIICRSGYSTIMDLTALGKKAILIPTPGQTEQVYLAYHSAKSGNYYTAQQHRFDLRQAMNDMNAGPTANTLHGSFNDHKAVLDNWLRHL